MPAKYRTFICSRTHTHSNSDQTHLLGCEVLKAHLLTSKSSVSDLLGCCLGMRKEKGNVTCDNSTNTEWCPEDDNPFMPNQKGLGTAQRAPWHSPCPSSSCTYKRMVTKRLCSAAGPLN